MWTASRIFECEHKEVVTPEPSRHAGFALPCLIFSTAILSGLPPKMEGITNLFVLGTSNPQYIFF